MTESRRKFLKAGTLASFFSVVHMKGIASVFAQHSGDQDGLFKIPIESQTDPLNRLTEEILSGYLNTKFQIKTSVGVFALELVKVTRWEPRSSAKSANAANLDCFAALLRGPTRNVLASGTYTVTHGQLGAFDLFVSPVNDHKKERLYEVVFNRLR